MRGCYFYSSPYSAASRRSYERCNSMTTEFELDGQQIRVEQGTTCSCRNVYYKMTIYIDGEKTTKNIRYIKTLLAKLESIAA
jgi:hypothetical protein